MRSLCTKLAHVWDYVSGITGFQTVNEVEHGNVVYEPQLRQPFEIAGPIFGALMVTKYIASSTVSSVFSAKRSGINVVIKYQADCEQLTAEPVHPLQSDFMNGRIAAAAGVSPAVHFISPAIPISRFCRGSSVNSVCSPPRVNPRAKLQFTVFHQRGRATQCMTHGVVRYMIMEKVGSCLHAEVVNGPLDPVKAIEYGIEVIESLRNLHERAGVIHGDIHAGNVCHRLTPPAGGGLALIDFGFALPVAEESGVPVRGRFNWTHPSLTPWQLEGYNFARRDDIYKTLYMMSYLMWGKEAFNKMLEDHSSSVELLLVWKSEGPLFEHGASGPFSNSLMAGPARAALSAVHGVVMELGVNEVGKLAILPYQDIIDRLNDVKRLLSRYPAST